MFLLVCLFATLLLVFLGGFLYVITNHVFVVEFGSGVWYFAVVLYVLLLIVSLIFIFHERFSNFPLWEKVATNAIILALSAISIYLGITYRPFLDVKVNEKLGALVDDILGSKVPDFPPAKARANIVTPPPLDQARASTCWAYSAALTLSTIMNREIDPGSNKIGCVEGIDVSKWSISPQALIDLFSADDKNAGAPVSEGLVTATKFDLPSLHCVSGYTSQFDGDIASCGCNGPKTNFCFLEGSGSNEHAKCSDGTSAAKTSFFRNKKLFRLTNIDLMERAITAGTPLIVFLSFRKKGYPLWAGVENNGINLKFRSVNFICRPRDEEDYLIDLTIGGHAVCIVGYGTREDGVDYWEIQNSWGAKWGHNGRAKIEKGVNAWGIEQFVVGIV